MKAIPFGSFKQLAKLTSINERIMNQKIDESHPDHAKALKIAGLAPGEFPSVKETLTNDIDKLKKKSKEDKKKKNGRNIHFCIGTCDAWIWRNTWNDIVPIHVILKRLRDKCDLKWLRISMSYHGFLNVGEMFQGDLNTELMDDITSKDFMDLKCNCANATTANGECICSGNCRKSMVIYKATCEECGCFCIGNTQQKLKNRMNKHFADAKNSVNNGDFSDSFAKHFASHFNNDSHITKGDVWNISNTEILWQGKPISTV